MIVFLWQLVTEAFASKGYYETFSINGMSIKCSVDANKRSTSKVCLKYVVVFLLCKYRLLRSTFSRESMGSRTSPGDLSSPRGLTRGGCPVNRTHYPLVPTKGTNTGSPICGDSPYWVLCTNRPVLPMPWLTSWIELLWNRLPQGKIGLLSSGCMQQFVFFLSLDLPASCQFRNFSSFFNVREYFFHQFQGLSVREQSMSIIHFIATSCECLQPNSFSAQLGDLIYSAAW